MAVTEQPKAPTKKPYRRPAVRSVAVDTQVELLMASCQSGFSYCMACDCCVEDNTPCPPE